MRRRPEGKLILDKLKNQRRLKNMVIKIDPNAFIFTSAIKEAATGVLKQRARH